MVGMKAFLLWFVVGLLCLTYSSSRVTITISDLPQDRKQGNVYTALKGENFRAKCKAKGYKNSNLTWHREGKGALPPLFIQKDLKVSNSNTTIHRTMDVKGFNHGDEGWYKCGNVERIGLKYAFQGKR
jgi:hypothetical protein